MWGIRQGSGRVSGGAVLPCTPSQVVFTMHNTTTHRSPSVSTHPFICQVLSSLPLLLGSIRHYRGSLAPPQALRHTWHASRTRPPRHTLIYTHHRSREGKETWSYPCICTHPHCAAFPNHSLTIPRHSGSGSPSGTLRGAVAAPGVAGVSVGDGRGSNVIK